MTDMPIACRGKTGLSLFLLYAIRYQLFDPRTRWAAGEAELSEKSHSPPYFALRACNQTQVRSKMWLCIG